MFADAGQFEIATSFGTCRFSTIEKHEAVVIKLRGRKNVFAFGGIAFHPFHSDFVWRKVLAARKKILGVGDDDSIEVSRLKPTRLPWLAIAAMPVPQLEDFDGRTIQLENLLFPVALGIVARRIRDACRN